MFKGTTFALAACFIWGLIFIVPQYMAGFSPIEITIARYSLYGIVSFLIFLKARSKGACKYPKAIWIKALSLSVFSTTGYYIFVILALRYSTPAICALILGFSPITIAFYGNWKQKEVAFRSLTVPSLLILLGLIVINAPHLMESDSPSMHVLGLFCALLALASWSYYVVINSKFLKQNPEVQSSDWSTLIGVTSLFWAGLLTVFLGLFSNQDLNFSKYTTLNAELISFLVGIGILGILCSWVGGFLWNKASLYLPVSLAGQLMIFETIFGVLFVYTLKQDMPPLMEGIGIVLLLLAIIYSLRQFYRGKSPLTSI